MVQDLPGKATSIWLDTTPETNYPPLEGNRSADAAIAGFRLGTA